MRRNEREKINDKKIEEEWERSEREGILENELIRKSE